MPGLLVPVSVVIVGHDRDPVQVVGNAGHVVADIDNLLARGDRSGEEKAVGPEGLLEFVDPGSEGSLVTVSLLLALRLHNSLSTMIYTGERCVLENENKI